MYRQSICVINFKDLSLAYHVGVVFDFLRHFGNLARQALEDFSYAIPTIRGACGVLLHKFGQLGQILIGPKLIGIFRQLVHILLRKS